MRKRRAALVALALVLVASRTRAGVCDDLVAAEPGISVCDAADDPVYDDGWQVGDDGGFGFAGGWTFETFNPQWTGFDLGSSTANGDADQDGDIDTGGRSWRLFTVDEPVRIWANRPLAMPLPLATPISLEIDATPPPYDTGSDVGFRLTSDPLYPADFSVVVSGQTRTYWVANFLDPARDTGVLADGEPVRFVFTRTGEYQYRLDATPRSGETHTVYGQVDNDLTQLSLTLEPYVGTAFFNRISVPEPDVVAEGIAVSAALTVCARRSARR